MMAFTHGVLCLLVLSCTVNLTAGFLDAQGLVQKTSFSNRIVHGCVKASSHWAYDGENQTLTITEANYGTKQIKLTCSQNKTWCLWEDLDDPTNFVNDSRMIRDRRPAEISVTVNKTDTEITFDPNAYGPPLHFYFPNPQPIPTVGWDEVGFDLFGDFQFFRTFEAMWKRCDEEQTTTYTTTTVTATTTTVTRTTTTIAASLKGDPHCANMKGEKFDVTKIGKLPMVIVPQGKNATEADFAVVSYVQPLRLKKCDPSYLQRVDIMWDSNCGRSMVRIGHGGVPEIETVVGERGHKCRSIKTVDHKGANTTIVNVGDFSVVVKQEWVLRKPLQGHRRLDMEVRGLGESKLPVGGIMGLDDHSQYIGVDPECHSRTALFENSPVQLEPEEEGESPMMQSFMIAS